jgi:dihydroxy-acid dehydratase
VVKTAGVPEEQWTFSGPIKVFESQEDAVDRIRGGRVVAGDVVVFRYEGPRARDAGDAVPDQLPQGKELGRACALATDGAILRRTSGLSIWCISPEADLLRTSRHTGAFVSAVER